MTIRPPQRLSGGFAVLLAALVFAPSGVAQERGELFERVVETLERRFVNRDFRRNKLPELADRFRSAAEQADSLAEECVIVDGFLSHVPSSHLALYTSDTHKHMMSTLMGRRVWTFGMQIKQRASKFFACKILEHGPAAKAGLLRGDRIVSIDGKLPHASPRLGRRTDDAYLPDAPLHPVLVERKASERVTLVIERRAGGARREVVVESARYSALEATRRGARVIEVGDRRIAYVHYWYIHMDCVSLLRKLVKNQFADCDAMIFDLRGRGGSGAEARKIVNFFAGRGVRKWKRPFVVLMDKESRSAKEMLAYEFKKRKAGLIIGEKSAGALVPAMFQSVGQGMTLMYPSFKIGEYTDEVELKGVEPDIEVAYPLPYTAGADPILQRAIEHFASVARSPGASRR